MKVPLPSSSRAEKSAVTRLEYAGLGRSDAAPNANETQVMSPESLAEALRLDEAKSPPPSSKSGPSGTLKLRGMVDASGVRSEASHLHLVRATEGPDADATAPRATPATPAGVVEPSAAEGLPVSRVLVTVYKLTGFGILTIILVGLVSYLAVNAFYFASTSWIVPTSLSPADEHVLQLDSIKSQESAAKGGLETQRLALGAQLSDARRVFESERAFQDSFRTAMATDLGDRKTQLKKLGRLLKTYAASKYSIQ